MLKRGVQLPFVLENSVIPWIEYPRPGTHLEDGRWLATVETGTSLRVEVLLLDKGDWYCPTTLSPLHHRDRVLAVAPPDPYRPR